MSRKADAIDLMKRVMEGDSYLTYKEIAKITGYHEKYLLKLKKDLEAGTISLVHGNTNRKPKNTITEEEKAYALKMFSCIGKAQEVPEKLMDVVVGVSGSAPAYVFMFIEAMADAAVEMGMPRKQAYEFAGQAVLGSAKLLLETGKHPGELKDMVCSPAGTTIAAVRVLEEKGMRAAVMDAVVKCIERSKEL